MTQAESSLADIVVGCDFSDNATHGVTAALWMARQLGSRVHVGTATSGHLDPEVTDLVAGRGKGRSLGELLDDVQDHSAERIGRLGGEGVPIDYYASTEVPAELLTRLAAEHAAGLIVVGASGMGAVKRWLVGSTADKLVRGAEQAVLVVKAHRPIRRILCAVDLSPASARALRSAQWLAERFDAKLHTLNVVEVPRDLEYDLYGSFWTEDYRNKLIEREERAYHSFLTETVGTGNAIDRHTAIGVADDAICQSAADLEADLLVLGSHGRHGLSAVVAGNTANRVLHRLPCSLLTIKDRGLLSR